MRSLIDAFVTCCVRYLLRSLLDALNMRPVNLMGERTMSNPSEIQSQSDIIDDFSRNIPRNFNRQLLEINFNEEGLPEFNVTHPISKYAEEFKGAEVQLNITNGNIYLNCGNYQNRNQIGRMINVDESRQEYMHVEWHLSIHTRKDDRLNQIYSKIRDIGWNRLNKSDKDFFKLGSIHIRAVFSDMYGGEVSEDYKLRMDLSERNLGYLEGPDDQKYKVALIDANDLRNPRAVAITRLANHCLNRFYILGRTQGGGNIKKKSKKSRKRSKRKSYRKKK